MSTRIIAAGTRFDGEPEDAIERLLLRLSCEPLEPVFERFGNFIINAPLGRADIVRFWGNFANVSHVFEIDTDDPRLIAKLTAAIRANQQSTDYQSDRRRWLEGEAANRIARAGGRAPREPRRHGLGL